MNVWLIEPRDPVIFRDGRPFNASPGARAKTLSFPFPSTLAGAARTRAGRDKAGHFAASQIPVLLQKEMRGPLLVELNATGGVKDWLFPVPADALILKQESYKEDAGRLVPLTVLAMPDGAETDLGGPNLVGPVTAEKEKPHAKAPAFWGQTTFEEWLLKPKAQDVQFGKLGISGPARESRIHVSIKSESKTAEEGTLFQTSGLEFTTLPAAPMPSF